MNFELEKKLLNIHKKFQPFLKQVILKQFTENPSPLFMVTSLKNFSSKADNSVYWIDCPIDWSFLILLQVSLHHPSQFSVICSKGLKQPVRNSMWCPVKDRKSRPGPSTSILITSKVSQLKKMSADSFPVLYFDFSSSAIDFESQIVGDDCWSSFTETTWIENKSLNQMMSPDSSRRNFIPFKPRFSERLESSDSIIWNAMMH